MTAIPAVPYGEPTDVAALAVRQAAAWAVPLLATIPVPGHATSQDWVGAAAGTLQVPGRNHPRAGAWLIRQHCPVGAAAADPMVGAGGLWLRGRFHVGTLYAAECCSDVADLARQNLELAASAAVDWPSTIVQCRDALDWRPAEPVRFILTSPPFRQNHGSGETEGQRRIREVKHLTAMQAFRPGAGSLAGLPVHQYWTGIRNLYCRCCSWLDAAGGVLVVVLRNYCRRGVEVDEIALHCAALRAAGFRLQGAHPRELAPTGYCQMRWQRDRVPPEQRVWTRLEWALVARSREDRACQT